MDEAARYIDRLCDELIDPEVLVQSERSVHRRSGPLLSPLPPNLLLQRNAVDFAHLQVWAHRVMQDDGCCGGGPRGRPAPDG